MSAYTDSVESTLKGCKFVSTGICPGCDECRESVGYVPEQTFAHGDGPTGDGYWYIRAVGVGASHPDEETCLAACEEGFDAGVGSGCFASEAGFSWSACGICGSSLGGDREVWHWVDDKNRIQHESDACTDCVIYLANGDEPEAWE